ncbi:MAG TPA: cytochrome b N-terminal domain-containing protein [Gemmataceae bacterium]|nr:cytochrome b N-terminal domain-containing protein [Gemmataceae bacterium]
MIRLLYDWADHRIGHRKFLDAMLLEHIPGGARWRYVWGSCLAFVFTIQLVTGVLLMTAYSPSDTGAWGSVHFIQYQMDFGWLIRGLHHFGSQAMVVLLAVHMLQVVIAGAQLPPREVNWWLGIALMAVVLGLSLTGYLLPWDQKGYYATQVATNIAGGIPGIGEFMKTLVIGGPMYGNHTLTRFYALHVWVLPACLMLLVVFHLALFRRHGVTHPTVKPEGSPHRVALPMIRDLILGAAVFGAMHLLHVPLATAILMGGIFVLFAISRPFIRPVQTGWFWPDQAFRDLVVCMFLFAILVSLVLSGFANKVERPGGAEPASTYESWAHAGQDGLGANLDAPADPETAGYPARPEWYFLFLFQLLKYFNGPHRLIGTLYIPNGALLLLLILPLLGIGRMRPFGRVVGILVVLGLLGGAATLTLLAMQEDSVEDVLPTPNVDFLPLSDEQKKAVHEFEIIPRTEAGRKHAESFQERSRAAEKEAKRAMQIAMAGNPVDGSRELLRKDPVTRGPKLFEMKCAVCHTYVPADPAKDALKFNDPKAKASDLAGYGTEKWIRGLIEKPSDPKYFGRTKLDKMTKWRARVDKERKNMDKDEIAKQDAEYDAIARFLPRQDDPKFDPKLREAGKAAFDDNCATCHKLGEPGPSTGPNLTGYGSQGWLRFMLMAPDNPMRYGDRNAMPAFRDFNSVSADVQKAEIDMYKAEKHTPTIADLSEVDREVLIRWLTHDPRAVFGGGPIGGVAKTEKK